MAWLRRMACLPLAWLGFGCAAALAAVPAQSELKVVVTVKPVHSLVAAVMAGVGEPRLLIDGFASPHTFSLKPSDAHALNKADLIFRVSDGLEPFMIRILKSLPGSVRVVTLEEAPGLTLHAQRTGGTFEDHAHGAGRRRHDHPHTSRADAGRDGHVWLDPANAKVIARYAAEVLSAEAPGDAAKFNANYRVLAERLDALSSELERRLRPLAGRPYVVFHDAYQYLERRYHLSPAGSVTISPDLMPSAKRLGALRRKIIELNATCVFVEPQFEPRLVDTVVEGTGARTGRLDPLGASVPAGPDLYLTLMRGLAADLEACLEGAT